MCLRKYNMNQKNMYAVSSTGTNIPLLYIDNISDKIGKPFKKMLYRLPAYKINKLLQLCK